MTGNGFGLYTNTVFCRPAVLKVRARTDCQRSRGGGSRGERTQLELLRRVCGWQVGCGEDPGGLGLRLRKRRALIAFMQRAVLAAHSLPALEGVRPHSVALQPPEFKEKAEQVGGIRQVNLGFEAVERGLATSRADHVCSLVLGVWAASVQAQLHLVEFCLSIVQCLFVAAGRRYWTAPGN